MSRGHPDRAVVHLAECARLEKQYSTCTAVPTIAQSAADLVEVHIRSGAMIDAERSLDTLEDVARSTGLKWANAGAARCRGMLAGQRLNGIEDDLRAHQRTTVNCNYDCNYDCN